MTTNAVLLEDNLNHPLSRQTKMTELLNLEDRFHQREIDVKDLNELCLFYAVPTFDLAISRILRCEERSDKDLFYRKNSNGY